MTDHELHAHTGEVIDELMRENAKLRNRREVTVNNLQWLYANNADFAAKVDEAAASWLGSTSRNFAHEWLSESHDGARDDRAELLARIDGLTAQVETYRARLGQAIDYAQAIARLLP